MLLLQEATLPWRDFEFRAGGFITAVDSGLALKSDSGLGAVVDVEDVLDLDATVRSVRLEMSWAVGARHRLHVDFYDLSRDGDNRLGQDLQVGNDVYPTGTDVETDLGLQLYTLTYGYSFFQDDRFDVAVTFGLHGLRTRVGLEAADLGVDKSERFFLPVPMPGLRADFALTPSFWLRYRLELLWFNVDEYRTTLVESSVGFELVLCDPVALGISYDTMRFRLSMEDEDYPRVEFRGEIEAASSGLMIYLSLFF